jgi:hypothetical protein
VIALELWDLLVNGRVLWETMQEPGFPETLCRTIAALRRGQGETRSEGRVPDAIAGFDSLYIAGGRSREPQIRSGLETLGLPMAFSQTPDFPGEIGGHRLLTGFPSGTGWLCDLGQTSFKICTPAARMQFRRDLQRLPVRTDGPGESAPEQRRQLREWLSESLGNFLKQAAAPNAILFAMPSRLDDAGVPEGSSYIGMAGDGLLIPDAMMAAGMTPRRVLVMNDAELATLDALDEAALRSCAKTLVITLGFGLGAALAFRTPAEGSHHA